VGDYTRCLAEALNAIGIEAHILESGHWRLRDAPDMHRAVRRLNPDVVHIQYPTIGFGTNLGPQAYALRKRCVITLHEAWQSHILRKLALSPFSLRSKRIIFPSEFERNFAKRWVPWISRRSSVIGVPSNIGAGRPPVTENVDEIVHFGLIMPNKGLEDVIRLAALIQASGLALRVRIIGKVADKYSAYFQGLRSQSGHLPIVWDNTLDKRQTEDRLAASAVAYLPYTDGVSERRASLKAALTNGIAVLTTRGSQTPPDIEDAVCFVRTPAEALVAGLKLLESPEARRNLAGKGREYVRQYSWERIAEQHSALYSQILDGRSALEPMPIKAERGSLRSLEP
jgi:glycosyltransferase involved in cell wall biosynthesis